MRLRSADLELVVSAIRGIDETTVFVMIAQIIHLTAPGMKIIECPKCRSPIPFRRSNNPIIDGSGFEIYDFLCASCRKRFSGIIDPYDDSLLVEVID